MRHFFIINKGEMRRRKKNTQSIKKYTHTVFIIFVTWVAILTHVHMHECACIHKHTHFKFHIWNILGLIIDDDDDLWFGPFSHYCWKYVWLDVLIISCLLRLFCWRWYVFNEVDGLRCWVRWALWLRSRLLQRWVWWFGWSVIRGSGAAGHGYGASLRSGDV